MMTPVIAFQELRCHLFVYLASTYSATCQYYENHVNPLQRIKVYTFCRIRLELTTSKISVLALYQLSYLHIFTLSYQLL